MPYETVLVGSDGSATAEVAVTRAAEVAAAHGALLVVVTAYTPSGDADARASTVPDDVRWAVTDVNQAEERIGAARGLATAAGVERLTTQAVAGSPADVILDAAERYVADLIVVGSKGLTRVAHVPLGSVAASVAHHAPCDVMIVHTTD